MCNGGGSDKAAKEANKLEQQRQANIQKSIAAINQIYDYGANADKAAPLLTRLNQIQNPPTLVAAGLGASGHLETPSEKAAREAEIASITNQLNTYKSAAQQPYRDYSATVAQSLGQDLARQTEIAQRNVRFGLARSGLTGGSADVDANKDLQHQYDIGTLKASQKGQQAYNDLLSKDMQTKQQLIGLAQGGLDATSAQSQALEAIRGNIADAQAQATYQNLGDIFGGLGQSVLANKVAQGVQQGSALPPWAYAAYGGSTWNPARITTGVRTGG